MSDISRLVTPKISDHLRRLARDVAYTEGHASVMRAAAAEIDRLTAHDAEVAARTLRDAAKDIYLPGDGPSVYVDIAYAEQLANQYLHARADQIEEGR